jgi:uncharacterized protein (TIGR00255 family)
MTGFSNSKGQKDICSWRWEIKSVNAKGLDVRFRLPAGFESIEKNLRDSTSKAFNRGNVSINLVVRWFNENPNSRLNSKFLEEILELLPVIRSKFPEVRSPTFDGLLAIRGVFETIDEELSDNIRKELEIEFKNSFEIALSSLLEMRKNEGSALKGFLETHLVEISKLISNAENIALLQPDLISMRLKHNVQSLLEDMPIISEDRLYQEIALLISKADIREEIDRLKAHEQAANDMIEKGGPIGRKLDFLCQEFNREVNTLCAKSIDIELTKIGMEMKSSIEQFREQIQNIE